MRLGDGLGLIRRDAIEKRLALDKITILISNPITNGVATCEPTILSGKGFWSNSTLVCAVWACTVTKKGENNLSVTVGSGKVKRC
jgi:hypothetical protein